MSLGLVSDLPTIGLRLVARLSAACLVGQPCCALLRPAAPCCALLRDAEVSGIHNGRLTGCYQWRNVC